MAQGKDRIISKCIDRFDEALKHFQKAQGELFDTYQAMSSLSPDLGALTRHAMDTGMAYRKEIEELIESVRNNKSTE